MTFALAGCGPGSNSPNEAAMRAPTAEGYARVAIGLMSSTRTQIGGRGNVSDLTEIIVDIDRVTAHVSGGWVTVSEAPVTVDILRLSESAIPLGFDQLPAGRINQIRLHVVEASAPFVTLAADGSEVPLKVPSGMQSGIKIKGPFDLDACTLTNITLDLDRKKSIHVHPNGHEDLWILRPVIRAGGDSDDVGCDDGMTPPPTDPSDGDGDGDGVPDPGDVGDGDNDDDGQPDVGDGDDDNDGTPDTDDPEPMLPGDGTDPGGNDPIGQPPGGGGSCGSSSDCGATAYCGESGSCVPLI